MTEPALTAFAVWSPGSRRVRLRHGGATAELRPQPGGWWRVELPECPPGTDYAYLLDDGEQELPDPRSPWQPHGVHGPSRVYDHAAFAWTDAGWTGRVLPGAVLYEMHIGTFTPQGTFDAAIERLDHLVRLGIDLVEVLPVNAFNGEHNWGYDGVCWYAPHEPYGGPDGFKRFVDACHARGLGVVLDVVYNHFGPSGAYPPRFAPYLAQARNTWGDALNLSGPGSDEVRRYIVESALMWLRDYHVDGLRLDAVHALWDTRAVHVLEQLAVAAESLGTHLGRPLTLIAESDLNDPRLITPREAGGYGLHAQWDDDVHHALHSAVSGETQGYYGDFAGLDALAEVMRGAFLHADTWSSFRERGHGRPVDRHRTAGHRFVVCLQNHDQIGNRARGDRLAGSVPDDLLRVAAVLLLTSAFTPMLFMGEEWAAGTPWQFFTSHPEPELAGAVAEGRRREFAAHGWPAGEVPDPQDPQTFARSRLDWSEPQHPRHAAMLDFYTRLIALRRREPELTDPWLSRVEVWHGDGHLCMRRGGCVVAANLSADQVQAGLRAPAGELLLATDPGVRPDGDRVALPPRSAAVLRYR
jgi:maltooligosyltrehalose trehalohydrolase